MFELSFLAPTGPYGLRFEPIEDTPIAVSHGDTTMMWRIEVVDGDVAQGMTMGAKDIWGNEFWFELHTDAPATISYYGDRALVRTDKEAL